MPIAAQRPHELQLSAKRLLMILHRLHQGRLSRGFTQLCAHVGVHRAALALQAACRRSLAQECVIALRRRQMASYSIEPSPVGHASIYRACNARRLGAVLTWLCRRRYQAAFYNLDKWDGQWQMLKSDAFVQTEEPLERLLDAQEQFLNGLQIVSISNDCEQERLGDGWHHEDWGSRTSAALVGPPSSRLQECPGWKALDFLLIKEEERRRGSQKCNQQDAEWMEFKSAAVAKPPSPYLQPSRPGSDKNNSSSLHRKPSRPRQSREGQQGQEARARNTSHNPEAEDLVPKPRYQIGAASAVDKALVKQLQVFF
eukprot:gnl/MRDRNA2_/MRDRNA2_122800_c0_seq1.p1 gnl/MRDRNA2_/MRDRNA2_122800_c0~~gnl/MRDRNA2_/MRDRNA2_122800_c0_seq1.p1  ORF type:complete len:313 (-),score=65.79 gnl/MRDRNA2_/MRDRNA2_122800_c0_seq1:10-948(-)